MIFATRASKRPAELKIFRNYETADYTSAFKNQMIYEVAKSTSAAPTYFRLEHAEYIDGGLVANNPTEEALVELRKNSTGDAILIN